MRLGLGIRLGAAVAGAIVSAGSPVAETNLLNLASAPNLVSWHEAESGITLDAAMYTPGSSPAITLTGSGLVNGPPIRIDIITGGVVGVMTFAWASDENGSGRVTLTSASTVVLGSTNITANFAAGTYTATAADTYNATVKEWEPKSGTTGAAGCRLDNSTVAASTGCIYEAHGLQGGIDRASVRFMPGMLGNQGSMAAVPAGAATPFHLFYVGEMTILAATTAILALFGFTSTSQTASHYIDWLSNGASNTPASTWVCQRRNSVPTTQRFDSDGTTGSFAAAKHDLSPHIFEIEYDGTTVVLRVDGFPIATGTWNGTVTCNRFTIGGVKLGASAATAFSFHRVSTIALYNAKLSAANAAAVRAAL